MENNECNDNDIVIHDNGIADGIDNGSDHGNDKSDNQNQNKQLGNITGQKRAFETIDSEINETHNGNANPHQEYIDNPRPRKRRRTTKKAKRIPLSNGQMQKRVGKWWSTAACYCLSRDKTVDEIDCETFVDGIRGIWNHFVEDEHKFYIEFANTTNNSNNDNTNQNSDIDEEMIKSTETNTTQMYIDLDLYKSLQEIKYDSDDENPTQQSKTITPLNNDNNMNDNESAVNDDINITDKLPKTSLSNNNNIIETQTSDNMNDLQSAVNDDQLPKKNYNIKPTTPKPSTNLTDNIISNQQLPTKPQNTQQQMLLSSLASQKQSSPSKNKQKSKHNDNKKSKSNEKKNTRKHKTDQNNKNSKKHRQQRSQTKTTKPKQTASKSN